MARISDIGQREFYICFRGNADSVSLYDRFICNEFRHIILFTPVSDTQVLVIDPLAHGISHHVKNQSIDIVLRKVKCIADCKIIKYTRPVGRKNKWRFRGLYNCVTLSKAVLNIWCWSLTPKQLFKYLTRQGGIILKG